MMKDDRLIKLVDYFDSTECFPGVDISGGICYFLWNKNKHSDCEIVSVKKGVAKTMTRPLLEENCETFIRFHEAVSIIRKIKLFNEKQIEEQISPRRPFDIDVDTEIKETEFKDSVKVYAYPQNGYIKRDSIQRNETWIDKWKVMIAKAYGERGEFPYLVLGKPFIGEPNSCCTETYLVLGVFDNEAMAQNLMSYVKTRFFRFLVLFKKNTQNAARGVYSFVPMQDFNEEWTDEKLYKKYGLSDEEIAYIESMIRPME